MRNITEHEMVLVAGGEQDGDFNFGDTGGMAGPSFEDYSGPIVYVPGTPEVDFSSSMDNPGFWGMVGAFGAAIVGIACAPEMVLIAGVGWVTAEAAAALGVTMVGVGGVGTALTTH